MEAQGEPTAYKAAWEDKQKYGAKAWKNKCECD